MTRATAYALSLMVLVGVTGIPQEAAGQPELGGSYIAQGYHPDGSESPELVQLTANGETFAVSWFLAHVSSESVVLDLVSVGIGIVSGEALAVSFFGMSTAGVAVYRIEDGGRRLVGQWTTEADDGIVHAETWIRLPDRAPEPAGDTSGGEPPPPQRPLPDDSAGRLSL